MSSKKSPFGSTVEAFVYTTLLIALLWSIFLVEKFYPNQFIKFGILPKTLEGFKGILFSPLIHSPNDIMHLVNNSIPTVILLAALIYFYRTIALKVFFLSWFITGFLVWAIAANTGSYHIGFSSVVYALTGFLFTSGTLRKYRPLQGLSLFVVFVYGSMIWGIFPLQKNISWEGHLFGLITGVVLAFVYRKKGPQTPKYLYEIEREMGIEPPDLEGIWLENQRLAKEEIEQQERIQKQEEANLHVLFGQEPKIQYFFKPTNSSDSHQDEKSQQE